MTDIDRFRELLEASRLYRREMPPEAQKVLDRFLPLIPPLLDELEQLRTGCKGVIPDTFIACSEGQMYCSENCHLKGQLARLQEILGPERLEWLPWSMIAIDDEFERWEQVGVYETKADAQIAAGEYAKRYGADTKVVRTIETRDWCEE